MAMTAIAARTVRLRAVVLRTIEIPSTVGVEKSALLYRTRFVAQPERDTQVTNVARISFATSIPGRESPKLPDRVHIRPSSTYA